MAIATQVEAVNAACAFLRGALGDMQLKRPRRMADGSLDDEHVDWAPVEVYAQYIPLETAAESARPELTGLTRCPSATVMLRGMALESAGGMGAEQVNYDLRVALLTYDPGVRPIDGHIELPDAQGWVSALALSDRVVLALRSAGAIDGCLVTGIKGAGLGAKRRGGGRAPDVPHAGGLPARGAGPAAGGPLGARAIWIRKRCMR